MEITSTLLLSLENKLTGAPFPEACGNGAKQDFSKPIKSENRDRHKRSLVFTN